MPCNAIQYTTAMPYDATFVCIEAGVEAVFFKVKTRQLFNKVFENRRSRIPVNVSWQYHL